MGLELELGTICIRRIIDYLWFEGKSALENVSLTHELAREGCYLLYRVMLVV